MPYTDIYNPNNIYDNTESGKYGWRILDKGIKNEDNTYTGVKLISTGIPAKIYYSYESPQTWWGGSGIQMDKIAYGLKNNFNLITFADGNYIKINNLETGVTGADFILNSDTSKYKVSNLDLDELNVARNLNKNSLTSVENNDKNGLFYLNESYWLASAQESNRLYMVNGSSSIFRGQIDGRADDTNGIRPVITLLFNVTFTKKGNVWEIDN